jgi:hypothetical protein
MKINKEKAFALTSLVVMTSIAWSIAFLSLQWYSSDARNSKRTSDLNNLQSAIVTAETKMN